MLWLYYNIGKMLAEKISTENWGAKVIDTISEDLQNSLPGLRGFSSPNLRKMHLLYEAYPLICSTLSNKLEVKHQKTSKPGKINKVKGAKTDFSIIKEIEKDALLKAFFSLSFSHHILIVLKLKKEEHRLFYLTEAVAHQWSYRILEYHIESNLHRKKKAISNNFTSTLTEKTKNQAVEIFKDEYLLDFININEDADERILESSIVNNIKQFIMRIGKGFSFIGNQHRICIEGDEFFVDLLFYNRHLQCLVAFELKTGKFKPEYAGKLNFYLNALDAEFKLPHENPSIGIILCKEKNNAVVEYSFKSTNKAMGVATYHLSTNVPKQLKGILPEPGELKKFLSKK